MVTRIHTINAEAHKCLHDILQAAYLDGECYAFAIALHRGLGWPMVALIQPKDLVPRHAAVYGPDKRLFDVRGPMSQDDPAFGEPFGYTRPYPLAPVTSEDLHRQRHIEERSILYAGRMAEILWPYLPWQDSEAKRVKAFADELEVLCRKHKLWIRSPYPAARPMLAKGEDDEGGYELRPTDDGMAYMIDRYFR